MSAKERGTMHIHYLHQYFITPRQEGGTRSYELGRRLVQKGHRVTMITSGVHNSMFPCPPDKPFTEYQVDGLRVVSVSAGYNEARYGTGLPGYKRILRFRQFAKAAAQASIRLEKPDVVFATHTPLQIGAAGVNVASHFKIPFVFEVRDLWPDALINIGALKNPLGIWYLRRLERKIYHAADHIVALSPGMKAGVVRQGIAEDDVTVIPNASDTEMFSPGVDGTAERERLGLGERFAATYFGAMGYANGLEYVLKAGQELKRRGNQRIVLVLHGEGGERQQLEAHAREKGLDNVIFSDPVPEKERLAAIVAASDAALTIYRATKEVSWSPNKFFDALAAGKPVIVNVPEWLGETVEAAQCGFMTDPRDPTQLADVLEKLEGSPELVTRMGRAARALAEDRFSRERMADRLETVLNDVIQRGPG